MLKTLSDVGLVTYTPYEGVKLTTPGDTLAFHYRTLHSAPPNPGPGRRRGFAHRWLGDDIRFCERPGTPSPPFPEMGVDLKPGDRMREDWFPTLWPREEGRP